MSTYHERVITVEIIWKREKKRRNKKVFGLEEHILNIKGWNRMKFYGITKKAINFFTKKKIL